MGWVTEHAVAIVSALLSALWAAVGIVVRQRATQRVPGHEAMSAAMAGTLVRQPLWWAGTVAAVAGYVFQAVALAHGSLLLVQPLLVSSLLFALPLSAALCHQRISRIQWVWAMLLTAALAVFLLVGQPREGHGRPPIPAWTLALAISVPSVLVCVVAAHRAAGRMRASLLGVAVAVLLGMIAVVTKVCTHRYSVGGWHALVTVPAPYVLVALAVTVNLVQNSAFHAGALQASVPIMLVGEPIVAVVLGVVVLGDHLAAGGLTALILVIAVVAMVTATIALGRSQAIDNGDGDAGQPGSPSDTEAGLATGNPAYS
ncbi:DMT family transporter [Mycobacterium sp. 94-17]|uniref:DMT family transporter n=1 Tax=Mycobacterium sp. 94-17 TaxID=2986147 RepID=UPI002D1F012A|nr:DMT family transporter [Mycobacterium sp. 94-17]MEB4208070.1 DMT family transporter [Mycobacterium sp. 94-17]